MTETYLYNWTIASVDASALTMMVEYSRDGEHPIKLNVPFPQTIKDLNGHVEFFSPQDQWRYIDRAKLINPDRLVNRSGTAQSTPLIVNTIGTSPIVFLDTPEVTL